MEPTLEFDVSRYIGKIQSPLSNFESALAERRTKLLKHPLFSHVQNIVQLRRFMKAHVFAVWDFMSLLKTLQNQLTCTSVPWTPPANPQAARFINEIVLGEESDEIRPGVSTSHFELYLEAMRESGASTVAIETFCQNIARGDGVEAALFSADAPTHVQRFVRSTLAFCGKNPHEVAAAFLYGREDIIPEMFTRLLQETSMNRHIETRTLQHYLQRHIEVDGDSHGPMARKLMQCLCAGDSVKWAEALTVAEQALAARKELWDGVLAELLSRE